MTDIPRDWLRERATVEDFEQARLRKTAAVFNLPLEKVVQKFADRPFGQMTEAWRSFVQQMEPDDELSLFSNPHQMSSKKLGCQGYAIVRDGTIRETFITLMT